MTLLAKAARAELLPRLPTLVVPRPVGEAVAVGFRARQGRAIHDESAGHAPEDANRRLRPGAGVLRGERVHGIVQVSPSARRRTRSKPVAALSQFSPCTGITAFAAMAAASARRSAGAAWPLLCR